MIFSKDYGTYLAKHTVEHLIDAKMLRTDKPGVLNERVNHGLLDELSLEDRINDEVRSLLNQYQDQMRQNGASYQEMFKLIKNKLVRERKVVL